MRHLLLLKLLLIAHTISGQENVTLNNIHKDSVKFYIGFQKANEQFNYIQAAQKFKSEKAGGVLQQVILHRAILPVNDGMSKIGEPASTTFILTIYDVDSASGAPRISLLKKPLIINNNANSMIKIDLSKYQIIISGKTFFVGIEWVFNERNKRLMLLKSGEIVKGEEFEVAALIYQPFLGMVKNNKNTSDAWVMTPDRKWKLYTHNMPYMTDLSISAQLTFR